jgi:hypothetical protein
MSAAEEEPTAPPELPPLHESTLAGDDLDALFRDLGALTRVIGILPKYGPRDHVDPHPAPLTLDAARDGLLRGDFRGLQIRYLYDDAEWWDTLLPAPGSGAFRIVRIQHALA